MAVRITIGKNNCLNDTALYINKTLPEITNNLGKGFVVNDYEAMSKEVERLKRVLKDLDDMVDELKNLQ